MAGVAGGVAADGSECDRALSVVKSGDAAALEALRFGDGRADSLHFTSLHSTSQVRAGRAEL